MSTYTAVTVPTQFVEANSVRFAYRRWGKRSGLPLVFNQHFTGNLDNWDPAVLDGLAKEREVIIFNNAGVASSTGEVPTTFCRHGKERGSIHRRSRIDEGRSSRVLDRRNGRAADHARPSGSDSQTHPGRNRTAQSRCWKRTRAHDARGDRDLRHYLPSAREPVAQGLLH